MEAGSPVQLELLLWIKWDHCVKWEETCRCRVVALHIFERVSPNFVEARAPFVLSNSISAVEETVTTKTTMIMSVLGRRETGKGGGCEPQNFHQAEREHFRGIAVRCPPPMRALLHGRSEIARCISPHSRVEARLLAPL